MAPSVVLRVGLALLIVSSRAKGSYDPDLGSPYGGTAAVIPGVIQLEEYDEGGEGVGYHDITPGNKRGAFRPDEDVDIVALDAGYAVCHVHPGEYLRFTVNVTKRVEAFAFNFMMASNTDVGSFRIVTGGDGCDNYKIDLSGLVTVPAGINYVGYEVSGQGTGGLRRGLNFIWMCIVSSFFNIDSFTMMSSSPSPTPTPTTAPVAAPIELPIPQGGAYRGLPATIPGTIQAEEFDEGGQNVAYRDTTRGNKKGEFRPNEDVDIAAMPDGGYNVGYIEAGESLRYTVDVTKKISDVFFSFRVASVSGYGSFRVVSGGDSGCHNFVADLSGIVSVPSTGGNRNYKDLVVGGYGSSGIRPGISYIWLCAESEGFNIDYFTIWKASSWHPAMGSFPTDVSVDDAFDSVPVTVPGIIEAEEFDTGGEGVGYSDTTEGNRNGVFRPNEDVDINELPTGGYAVGDVAAGEYLRYTVDCIKKVDDVIFNFRVASSSGGGSFRVVAGGNGCDDYKIDASGIVSVPSTGGNRRFIDLEVSGNGTGGVRPGQVHMYLCILSKGFSIDYFSMSKASTKG